MYSCDVWCFVVECRDCSYNLLSFVMCCVSGSFVFYLFIKLGVNICDTVFAAAVVATAAAAAVDDL